MHEWIAGSLGQSRLFKRMRCSGRLDGERFKCWQDLMMLLLLLLSFFQLASFTADFNGPTDRSTIVDSIHAWRLVTD